MIQTISLERIIAEAKRQAQKRKAGATSALFYLHSEQCDQEANEVLKNASEYKVVLDTNNWEDLLQDIVVIN